MKKKLGLAIFLCLPVLLLTSCDQVLSVVTVNKNGEKVVTNYIASFRDTFYDENATLKSWQKLWQDIEDSDSSHDFDMSGLFIPDMENLLFKIEDEKENLVVFGDEHIAVELSFFDGGYKCMYFYEMDELYGEINKLNK